MGDQDIFKKFLDNEEVMFYALLCDDFLFHYLPYECRDNNLYTLASITNKSSVDIDKPFGILKKELTKLDVSEIPIFLEKNGLSNMFSKYLYHDFIKGEGLEEMNLTEKIIILQYTIDNFNVTKEQLIVLLERMES